MKKFKVLIIAVYSAITLAVLFTPSAASAWQGAVADAVQQRSELIQNTFEQALFAASKDASVDDMSSLTQLMGFLMVLNIFMTLYKKGPDQLLLEMAKMAVWSFFALCIMGGSFYSSTGLGKMFAVSKNICGTNFEYRGGISLDRDLLNFVKHTADDLACALYQEDVNSKYNIAVSNMFIMLTNINSVPEMCKANLEKGNYDSLVSCIREFNSKSNIEKAKSQCGTGISDVTCYLGQFINMIRGFGVKVIIEIILIIVQILVQVVQYLLMFVMIIGISGSLLMLKLISPFLVLESVRSKVLHACKVPLAIAFYSFTQKTMLFFITGLLVAITDASLICFAKFAGQADGIIAVYLIVSVAALAALTMQIIIILKVPKFSLMLVNLSLQEFVNISGEMLKAAFGMSMTAAAAVAGAAATAGVGALAAGGGAAASGLGGLAKAGGGAVSGGGRMMGMGFGPGGPKIPGGLGGGGASSSMISRGARGQVPPYVPRQGGGLFGSSMTNPQSPTGGGAAVVPGQIPAITVQSQPASNNSFMRPSKATSKGPKIRVSKARKSSRATLDTPSSESGSEDPNLESQDIETQPTESISDEGSEINPVLENLGNTTSPDSEPLQGKTAGTKRSINNDESEIPQSSSPTTPVNPRARRQRNQVRDFEEVQDSALQSAQTFKEFNAAKDRFNKQDSPGLAQQKRVEDAIYGTFGTKQGRAQLRKKVVSGGAKVLRQVIMDAFSATPGNEMTLGGFTAGNSDFKSAFQNEGTERYKEFRETIENEERKRQELAESGIESINESEAIPNTIMSDVEYDKMMSDLDGVIIGGADEKTRKGLIKKIGGGMQTSDAAKAKAMMDKYQLAAQKNSEFKEERVELLENSQEFIRVVSTMIRKTELSNDDIANLQEVLSMPINKRAISYYTENKDRLMELMKARLNKMANVRVK